MNEVVTIFKGRALVEGEKISGTALTFIKAVSRRRGCFQCDCGTYKFYNISDMEGKGYKSCGCGVHRKQKYINSRKNHSVLCNTL
jgi:hypothetical protein